MPDHHSAPVVDLEPSVSEFRHDVLEGLRNSPKQIPCKYFYDQAGAQLFDEICELEEYYLTRTEIEIMQTHAAVMAAYLGAGVRVVEYGSGSSTKTRILLEHLVDPAAYVPVDISREHLRETATRLRSRFQHIEILPVCADFTQPFEVPDSKLEPTRTCVYFPGSTIGNFTADQTSRMLQQIVDLCGQGGGLLLGIDLQKDPEIINRAYNDSKGVTEQFNRNVLRRINRELKANFDVAAFTHVARYNESVGRVEISLQCQAEQQVEVAGETFLIADGEHIHTEYSYKYRVDSFSSVAAEQGLSLKQVWTDPNALFGVLYFEIAT